MAANNILIVDDEKTECKILEKFITNQGYNALVMNSGMEAVDFFVNKKVIDGLTNFDIDVMLLDLSMPDLDGISVLKKIHDLKSDVQVIVLTGNSDIELAVKAISLGATDYIVKEEGDIYARLKTSIKNAIDKKNLKYQVSNLVRKDQNQVSFSDILGKSENMMSVINLAKKSVPISIPILIEGQSGAGKELLARAIHGSGIRSGKPFVTIECDMIKPELMEEYIFGLDKGSNGKPKIGKIREAEGGTILFKKVEFLTIDMQMKLLRFLQDGEFYTADGLRPIKSNARFIASTTKSDAELSDEKKFRQDFKYAISIFPISIPSLNERGEDDIKLMSEHFLRTFAVNENKKVKSFSFSVEEMLKSFDWKGNVRQLKNYIFRAVILCDDSALQPEHFPQILNADANSSDRIVFGIRDEVVHIFKDDGKAKSLADIEEEIAKKLMTKFCGNISEVAKQLNIARSTLYRKLRMDESDIDNMEKNQHDQQKQAKKS